MFVTSRWVSFDDVAWVVGMGGAVWTLSVFDFFAFRVIRMQLVLLWSGGPLIAKAI